MTDGGTIKTKRETAVNRRNTKCLGNAKRERLILISGSHEEVKFQQGSGREVSNLVIQYPQ